MDDPANANTTLQSIQGAWSTLLTILGALIVWNGRRLIKQIDQKADQKDLDAHKHDLEMHKNEVKEDFRELKQSINNLIQTKEQQHQQNTERLDRILAEVYRRGP